MRDSNSVAQNMQIQSSGKELHDDCLAQATLNDFHFAFKQNAQLMTSGIDAPVSHKITRKYLQETFNLTSHMIHCRHQRSGFSRTFFYLLFGDSTSRICIHIALICKLNGNLIRSHHSGKCRVS